MPKFSDRIRQAKARVLDLARKAKARLRAAFAPTTLLRLVHKTKAQLLYCLAVTVILLALLAHLGPQQVPVLIYKLVLPVLGGVAGGCLWLALVPIGNPARWLKSDWRKNADADVPGAADFEVADGCTGIFCVCLACMAAAVCSGMLAVAWGL